LFIRFRKHTEEILLSWQLSVKNMSVDGTSFFKKNFGKGKVLSMFLDISVIFLVSKIIFNVQI
jgi:hypothetical protein